MSEQKITRKAIIEACVVAVAAVAAGVCAFSQKTSIGQKYQSVTINGETVGHTTMDVDVAQLMNEARRALALPALERGERLCMDYTWDVQEEDAWFAHLMTEEELTQALTDALADGVIAQKTRAYTVAIEDYRANFSSLEEVCTFLNAVKAAEQPEGDYEAENFSYDSEIAGILQAELREGTVVGDAASENSDAKDDTAPEAWTGLDAGISRVTSEALSFAAENPDAGGYQTGILGMEFVEEIYVYENYVDADAFAVLADEVEEVTKEKESNKIYVVERGECLSIIALDHDTTVASIVALNGLEDPDSIREGQELIIAVPEPDLKLRVTVGEVYEEDYKEDPVIIENDAWYTTKEVILDEGTTGHRERNDVVVYENGMEISREMIHENIMVKSEPMVIERGTIIPPTYIKPLAGGVFTSGYGQRWGRLHKGVDWACPVGTTLYASSAGTVIQASYSSSYGYNVVISHPDGRMTRYAHCSKLLVTVGEYVEQGETIALSGNTGDSTGPHVHFEIYINGVAVNPLDYIGY